MSSHETLGLLLVREGLVSRPQLYEALRLQRRNARLLGTCLIELGFVDPHTVLRMLSRQLGLPVLPPGALSNASPAALGRVPAEVAWRLRVVPYSWDRDMLAVAIADCRVIGQLRDLSVHSQSAVGAYVALEMEIEEMLHAAYGPPSTPQTRSLGPAASRLVAQPASRSATQPVVPPRKTPPAMGTPVEDVVLDRMGLYDAVENVYEGASAVTIARPVGRALLNYFARVLMFVAEGDRLRLAGRAGTDVGRLEAEMACLPQLTAELGEPKLSYGPSAQETWAAELAAEFGFPIGATALLATTGSVDMPAVVAYADNGDDPEPYEDLHDVELLLREASTALAILLRSR